MTRSIDFRLRAGLIVLALLFPATLLFAQEQPVQKTNFYDVQVSKDEIYSYKDLKFTGDYSSLDSASGFLALGKTEVGVTIAIILGAGSLSIEAPEATYQEKIKTIFGMYPLKTTFKSIYMRLHPKEYDATIGKMALTKVANDEVFTKAKEIYDQKFLGSYHAGPKALLPPERTRVMDFDTDAFGQVFYEEGYWIKLRRLSPYGNVYPSTLVNPKQK